MTELEELKESFIEEIQGWEVVTTINNNGEEETYLEVECEDHLLEMDIKDIKDLDSLTKEILAEIIVNKYVQ